MASKTKPSPKTTQKSIADANWGNTFQGGTITAKALQSLDKTLSPSEAFALSIDVQAAINAITTQFAKLPIRLFHARSMAEIESGPVVDFFRRPAPGYSTGTWLSELINWHEIFGEIAGSVLDSGKGRINCLPLCPARLGLYNPTNPTYLSDVVQWRYNHQSGVIDIINTNSLVFAHNFNPLNPIRGLSPLLAAVNEISAGYESIKYNRTFFSNNAEPSHIVVLPDAISTEDREAFTQEYLAAHSTYNGNAHKVMVVSGTDLKVEPISTQIKDAQFVGLTDMVTSRIAMLKKVSAAEMGIYSKTRFETADIERRMFFENSLLPRIEMLEEILQHQVVDRYFANTATSRGTGKKHISKTLANRVEKAREVQGDSEILIVLDADSLPIALQVKQAKIAYAQLFQQTFKVSPRAAAEEIGMEIEETDANELVWTTTTEQPYVSPEDQVAHQAAIQAVTQPAQDATATGEGQQAADDQKPANEQDTAAAKAFAKSYRKLMLDSLDAGRMPKLSEADSINTTSNQTIHDQIRRDHVAIKALTKTVSDLEERKDLVRAYLNKTFNRAFYKAL